MEEDPSARKILEVPWVNCPCSDVLGTARNKKSMAVSGCFAANSRQFHLTLHRSNHVIILTADNIPKGMKCLCNGSLALVCKQTHVLRSDERNGKACPKLWIHSISNVSYLPKKAHHCFWRCGKYVHFSGSFFFTTVTVNDFATITQVRLFQCNASVTTATDYHF